MSYVGSMDRDPRQRADPDVSPGALSSLRLVSTIILLTTFALANFASLGSQDVDEVLRITAIVVFVGLTLAIWVEARAGLRNLIRVDLFMLVVLFLLTFFEFVLPQDSIKDRVSLEAMITAINATLLGFAGITIGRHAIRIRRPMPRTVSFQVSRGLTVSLLLSSAFLGYLYMLVAVRFDIFEMIYQMSRPRFSQPWTRGRLGSISTLLNEFSLLKYLIPPLAASILAQRHRYKRWHIALALGLLGLVLFEGFSGGTRNIFLTHLMTFGATFALLKPKLSIRKLLPTIGPLLAIAFFAVVYLPEIRTVGLRDFELANSRTETVFVDMNLINIALLTEVFPVYEQYLLLEVPYVAAIRPIPRAIWSGKPEGLSVGIEEALGATNLTLAATFVGELWISGGYIAIIMGALIFGALAARWNRKAASARSNIDMIYFAMGLFPAGICMRSFMSVFPTLLPLLAMAVYLKMRRR